MTHTQSPSPEAVEAAARSMAMHDYDDEDVSHRYTVQARDALWAAQAIDGDALALKATLKAYQDRLFPTTVERDEARDERDRLKALNAELVEALKWATPLAAIALEAHRYERNKTGLHEDITFVDDRGTKCVGLWQSEYDALSSARALLARAEGK